MIHNKTLENEPGDRARKRYVGRSATRRDAGSRGPQPYERARESVTVIPMRRSGAVVSAQTPERSGAHTGALKWSGRLIVSLVLISLLAAGLRLPGFFLPPLDAGTGVEATYAATANLLAGRIELTDATVRAIPVTPPWTGMAPADPGASLPLYTWLFGYGMRLLGAEEWLGRLITMLGSVGAGLALFAVTRRVAGARAALYTVLIFSLAPLSVVLGAQIAPFSLALLFQVCAALALVAWRQTLTPADEGGSGLLFGVALGAGTFAALLSPGALALILAAAYAILAPPTGTARIRQAWSVSRNKGRFIAYASCLVGVVVIWGLFREASASGLTLAADDGGAGVGAMFGSLFNGSTYLNVIGVVSGKALTIVGLLLVVAGLLREARPPLQWFFHYWLAGAALVTLLDSARLERHDDVLMPLLPPLFALAGAGAAWAGSLPARVWMALAETRRERDSDYAVSPHTAWLLDLPEQRLAAVQVRPQAKPALAKSLAQRSRAVGSRVRRVSLMLAGHMAMLASIAVIGWSGWQAATARATQSEASVILSSVGAELAQLTSPGAQIIVAGPQAPGIFHSAHRTGWAVPPGGFSLPEVQRLQREGASYLVSADQEWLGKQADYVGILTNYAVAKLTRDYILFDLGTKPAQSDRLYFLESGHTLNGEFRRFWETHGGLEKLGYPISEELRETNPLDGQERTVQYFERAVLEYHADRAGTTDAVMLAAVGRWVTRGRNFQPVAPFQNTQDRVYFPQTGHSLKESFLRFWLRNGDVRQLGYPISEELPEISAQDGKVYTVQYFERARLEWHPTEAGGPKEVQLGLIGKQAYEMRP